MVLKRAYLGLDFNAGRETFDKGSAALNTLQREFGVSFVAANIGVKLNIDAFTGTIASNYVGFSHIFADLKVAHGADTAKRVMERVREGGLDIELVTMAASMGGEILHDFVEDNKKHGTGVVAFTVHTKIAQEEVQRMYGRSLEQQIAVFGAIAQEAGCAAMVCEGKMLEVPEIKALQIPKLVTGIRVDPKDAGSQRRVTKLEDLVRVIDGVEYVVISHKNVAAPETLPDIVRALFRNAV